MPALRWSLARGGRSSEGASRGGDQYLFPSREALGVQDFGPTDNTSWPAFPSRHQDVEESAIITEGLTQADVADGQEVLSSSISTAGALATPAAPLDLSV